MIQGIWGIGRKKSSSLPYDARVLYVETDGLGSYINTGVVPDATSDIKVTFKVVSVPVAGNASGNYNVVYGACSTNSAWTARLVLAVVDGTGVFIWTSPFISNSGERPAYDNGIHDVEQRSGTVVFDGVARSTGSFLTTYYGDFCLGTRGTVEFSSNPQNCYTNTRFYSCKIYMDNVLVFDGIPVRKSGQGYIYDRVSGRLCGNAGAAGTSVTCGPDVPFDEYVEYLEGTGTQYVGTAIQSQDNIRALSRFCMTGGLTTSTNDFPFFAPNGRTGFGLYSIYNTRVSESAYWIPHLNVGYSVPSTGVIHSDDNWHVCELDSTSGVKFAKLDGTEIYSVGTTNTNTGLDLCLFARTSSTIGQGKISMFSVKNTSTGTEMVNFAPVRVGQTGCMYDRANPTGGSLGNGLYPNLGTGNFVFGADV